MLAEAKETTIEIQRLTSAELIAGTIGHPRVYPQSADDFSPAPEQLPALTNPNAALYLGAFDGPEYLGLFVVEQRNGILFEVHTCLLPTAWGERAVECAKRCARWIFDNTTCRRIVTSVPDGNLLALRLAKAAGMVEYGISPRSIQRGGRLLDQRLLGIDKEA